MELRDTLRLDLMAAMSELGVAGVLEAVSSSCREVGGRRFDDWNSDLAKLAEALQDLAAKAADFEAHYGSREP